jgi:putative transposase
MVVLKSHKILLRITPKINDVFLSWCGAARWAYNYGLERKINSYKEKGKSEGGFSLMKEIVDLKKTDEYAWLNNVPKSIPRVSLKQLDKSYLNFFQRAKSDEKKKGFPKFKSKKHSKMSFHLEPDSIAVKDNHVRIPKLGWLKMYQPIRFIGKLVGTICISKRAGRWYASFAVETEIPDPIENQEKVFVGLDVGIKHLAILSDGKKFDNPKAFYQLERLLARAQRQMERKQKESKRWQRAKLRVERIYERMSNMRANATHKISAYVARNYSGVAIEDLNVMGMLKNTRLSKSIMDANFAELHRQLNYKMAWAGGEVRQVGRFFPSSKTCSICGTINDKLTLADREWICECGEHHDRDINAANNLVIKCFGRGLAATARGGLGATRPTNETRTINIIDRTEKASCLA